jgi:membrane carboxypeptidase/penicillin-binding protein
MTHFLAILAHVFLPDACSHLARSLRKVQARNADAGRVAGTFVTALVLAEDRRFFRHGGIDAIAICRALFGLLTRRNLGGGSTVEQQLVRTLRNDRARTLLRKLREVLLAATVRESLGKRSVAVAYLRVAYFGWRMNGIEEACRRLGVVQAHASTHEAARIVARLKYPQSMYAPMSRVVAINARVRWIARLDFARRRERLRRRDGSVFGIAEV